jgi:hypothetical protein
MHHLPGPDPIIPKICNYPGSFATDQPIARVLANVLANAKKCSSIYLDTLQSMGGGTIYNESNHAQGLARSHVLSNNQIYFFLSYSEIGARGTLSQYSYAGPLDGSHVVETSPLQVAPMQHGLLKIDEEHPSDLEFLPDINYVDAGYLFVTEEFQRHRLVVYRWTPGQPLEKHGHISHGFSHDNNSNGTGPNFVFLDRVGDRYYLGVASQHWGWGILFSAECQALFPTCKQGEMKLSAFQPVSALDIAPFPPKTWPPPIMPPADAQGIFPFPTFSDGLPSQVKLVLDSTGEWYLLAFRSDPDDKTLAVDYVDVYPVQFNPFKISGRISINHVTFVAGDTSFASTGTHYVEPFGRFLVSCSYRWAKDDLPNPGQAGYVTRVDECPSF